MTPLEVDVITAFKNVAFPMWTKRKAFAQDMVTLAETSPDVELTKRQKRYVALLAHQFRAQLPERLHFQIEVMRAVYDKAQPREVSAESYALACEVHAWLSKVRFDVGNEKRLQHSMHIYLANRFPLIEREVRLSERDIIDFMVDRVGIEVKVKGAKRAIFQQLVRYSDSDKIDVLLLATNKAMGMPEEIQGKPVLVLNLGMAWL